MTTELTKAAQQALEALKNVTDYDQINAARRALQSALTQRPAAEAGERDDGKHLNGLSHDALVSEIIKCAGRRDVLHATHMGKGMSDADYTEFARLRDQDIPALRRAILARIATQPAAQATPEPAGKPVHQIRGEAFECPHAWRDATEEAFYTTPAADRRILYTRPASGVPEGFVLVPVEPTPEMLRCAEMWDDGFEGAYARALAAAQAKK